MADGLHRTSKPLPKWTGTPPARILADAAHGADDGEIFAEDSRTESFFWDDGRLKSASFDATQGFGLRVVAGERAGYGHASVLDTDAVGARRRSGRRGEARPCTARSTSARPG